MMPNLAEVVAIALNNVPPEDSETVKRYEDGIEMLNDLVKRGLTKHRGYQLEGIDDSVRCSPLSAQSFLNAKNS